MQDIKNKLKVIEELMTELADSMEPSANDFNHRLGRNKPDVKVLEVKGQLSPDEENSESPDYESSEPMSEDISEGEPMDHQSMMSPDEQLKARLLKIRGK